MFNKTRITLYYARTNKHNRILVFLIKSWKKKKVKDTRRINEFVNSRCWKDDSFATLSKQKCSEKWYIRNKVRNVRSVGYFLDQPCKSIQSRSTSHAKFQRVQRNWYPYVEYPPSATVNNGGDRAKLTNGISKRHGCNFRFSIRAYVYYVSNDPSPAKKPINKVTHAVTYEPNFQIEWKWPRTMEMADRFLFARQRWSTLLYPEAGKCEICRRD